MVTALNAGADDHVTKPFGVDQLLARIPAVTRSTPPPTPGRRAASYGWDDTPSTSPTGPSPRDDGTEVRLTPTQWSVLEKLLRHPGKLITQRQLLHDAWGRTTTTRPATCAIPWPNYAASSKTTPPDRSTSSPNPACATASAPDSSAC
ncbi:response regulator transcription factor [Micromonospora sp. NPDC005299]|uniref:response regulator transcription factor n=1 Tax=Micromonospora sp. NPDC005299 TaxID=3364231 RepID=UPI00369B3C0F